MGKKKLTTKEEKMSQEALFFIKNNKKLLINKFADPKIFTARKEPVTIFMAGAPGVGKTEISKEIIKENRTKPVRIDADDIRGLFTDIGYNGKNSFIFQRACSHGVDKLFDYVQRKRLHAIVDGTFAHDNAINNVKRALGRSRRVFIYFIYQDPIIAWKVTKGRELKEGRSIPAGVFVKAYFSSIKNVNRAKAIFKDKISLNIIIKNVQHGVGKCYLNKNSIDHFIEKSYNEDKLLEGILKL